MYTQIFFAVVTAYFHPKVGQKGSPFYFHSNNSTENLNKLQLFETYISTESMTPNIL